MTLISEKVFTPQLLRDANLHQISIRERRQPDSCDPLCWVTEIRNLTDRIKNKPTLAFNY